MAFCKYCGQELGDNATFCNRCGQPVAGTAVPPYTASATFNLSDHTAEFDPAEAEDCRVLAAIMYFTSLPGIAVAVLLRPNSKFIKYHANQALVLDIFMVLAGLCGIVPILGWIVASLAALFGIVLKFIGLFRALGRKAKDLPLIGGYTVFDYRK